MAGSYRTVLRRTGHGWLAIRMCEDEELFRAQGKTWKMARMNLKNYEAHRKSCDGFIGNKKK
jgi:hypothetical protein